MAIWDSLKQIGCFKWFFSDGWGSFSDFFNYFNGKVVERTQFMAIWKSLSSAEVPAARLQHVQKAWNGPIAFKIQTEILGRVNVRARLLAAASRHSGHAPPISSIGLRLDKELIQVFVDLRLGVNICEPHTCACQKMVDVRGLHGLSCRRSTARRQRHAQINEIIHRAILRTQTPSSREPVGLVRNDGKWPDCATLIPGPRGKLLAWDVTVVDTFADLRIHDTSSQAGEAANKVSVLQFNNKIYLHQLQKKQWVFWQPLPLK